MNFIQQQLLGMKWLNDLIGQLLELIGLDVTKKLGGSLQFFIFDTIKILILLTVLIFIISYIQSYFPPERSKRILGRFHGIRANAVSALLGTVTPFCSCSSIPLFIGFSSAGLPVGVTFSFLISSPMVDLGSLIILMSIFGYKVAFAYVIVGLVIAILGGTLIEKLGMDKYVEPFVTQAKINNEVAIEQLSKWNRISYATEQVKNTVKKIIIYILIGVAIGAVIHNVIPAHFIQSILGNHNIFSVLLATAVGIPMYADVFGTIPIAEALLLKGVGLGTVLSFMMAVTALSLPSMIMLKKVVKARLLGVFIAIVSVGIIIMGYLFNVFQTIFL